MSSYGTANDFGGLAAFDCSSAARHASPTAFLSRVWCCFSSSFRINRRDHSHTPRAVLSEPPCLGRGWRFGDSRRTRRYRNLSHALGARARHLNFGWRVSLCHTRTPSTRLVGRLNMSQPFSFLLHKTQKFLKPFLTGLHSVAHAPNC